MKILVTGGAGFIGSAVIRHIIQNTQGSVINLDKLTYAGNLESLANVSDSKRYAFERVDICNREELDRVFKQHQPDAVMHLAAESHVDRSIDGPAEFIQTNIVGTYTLLEAARAYWNQLDSDRKHAFRFHHISTDEVYGDLPHPNNQPVIASDTPAVASAPPVIASAAKQSMDCHGLQPRSDVLPLFTETTAYAPSSPYSASKASSDHLVRAWHRTYGLPILVTNCSNNYGPYHFPEKLVPHIILNALAGKPLPVYGDGSQIRDWLYVEDHARALVKVATEGVVGETYNIGGHNEKRNIDVVHILCALLEELASEQKPEGLVKYQDLITFVTDRAGHDVRYAIDASKIERDLGWVPEETFETGMRKTVQWYLDNSEWWQRVLNGDYKLGRLGVKL